ncbi:MAG: hypothetical protein M0T74_03610 [Desulfitobacterium hafniense]|nr:hypothetical protein [Desulfitobacterium hafniense]
MNYSPKMMEVQSGRNTPDESTHGGTGGNCSNGTTFFTLNSPLPPMK